MEPESDSVAWADENHPVSPKASGSASPSVDPEGKERTISFSISVPTNSFDLSKITASVTVSSASSTSTNTSSVSTMTTPSVDWKMTPKQSEKQKLISNQLALLLHAQKCIQLNAADNSRKCTLEHCLTMKDVLWHLEKCAKGKKCTFPHCASSRQIIYHFKTCKLPVTCSVCAPIKKLVREVAPGPSRGSPEAQAQPDPHLIELINAQEEWHKLNEDFASLTERVCKLNERQKTMREREQELKAAMDSLLPVIAQIPPEQADTVYNKFLWRVHANIMQKQHRLSASYAIVEQKLERLKKRIEENQLATRAAEERGDIATEQLQKQEGQPKKPQPKPLGESFSVNERKNILTMMKQMRLNKKTT